MCTHKHTCTCGPPPPPPHTHTQDTLLHLAGSCSVDTVLPLVVQAYKRAKLFTTAMNMLSHYGCTPLDVALDASNFENTVLLFRECLASCPDVVTQSRDDGAFLFLLYVSTQFVYLHEDWVYLHEEWDFLLSQQWNNIKKVSLSLLQVILCCTEQSIRWKTSTLSNTSSPMRSVSPCSLSNGRNQKEISLDCPLIWSGIWR